MKNNIDNRINELRKTLKDNNISAFIIPTTDAHLSEYPALHWSAREWISGFTGSAGIVVVTLEKAALWADSRYDIQAENELKGTSIIQMKKEAGETPASIVQWLAQELKKGETIGIDGVVYASKDAETLKAALVPKELKLRTDFDPFTNAWADRPQIPENKIFIMPEAHAGESAKSKIARIGNQLATIDADVLLVASLDTIAWIFNIRGNDVNFNPVAVSYACVSKKEAVLFINPKKLTDEVSNYLKAQGVILADYDKAYDYVSKIKGTVCLDSNKIAYSLYNTIPAGNRIIDMPSPADLMKGIKNETELKGFRNALQRDGVAMVKFLRWLENAVPKGTVTELAIGAKLVEFRSQQKDYVGESFSTIAGYAGNAAIVHYHATAQSSLEVKPKGLLLVDSGAQYFDGTTDITRTIAVGELTEEMKTDYTLVLKGHIQIATAIYPKGTRGSQLDILARKAMWDTGLNYLHGTGHGIGHFLNVHEGPQNIRLNENPTTLEIGMVTSNEPGMYRAGKHGIRIENLIATQKEMTSDFGDFYSFETLTVCPIDTAPIVKSLLTTQEIDWFNKYHQFVYDRLATSLNEDEKQWLKEKTNEI